MVVVGLLVVVVARVETVGFWVCEVVEVLPAAEVTDEVWDEVDSLTLPTVEDAGELVPVDCVSDVGVPEEIGVSMVLHPVKTHVQIITSNKPKQSFLFTKALLFLQRL